MTKRKKSIIKKQSFIEKIKNSVKALSYIFLILVSFVLMAIGKVPISEYLKYTVSLSVPFWGIREVSHWRRSRYNNDDHDV